MVIKNPRWYMLSPTTMLLAFFSGLISGMIIIGVMFKQEGYWLMWLLLLNGLWLLKAIDDEKLRMRELNGN